MVTAFIFIGLTLFTLQGRYDFSGLGPWLFTGLMFMLGMGLVGFFFNWGKVRSAKYSEVGMRSFLMLTVGSQTTDLVYSGFGVLLFSGYILYDTSMIMNRLSPDEW